MANSPEGDYVPLPAVVARLAARSFLPPPRSNSEGGCAPLPTALRA